MKKTLQKRNAYLLSHSSDNKRGKIHSERIDLIKFSHLTGYSNWIKLVKAFAR